MTNVIRLKLAVCQIPDLEVTRYPEVWPSLKGSFQIFYLNIFVPATRDNDGVRVVGREPDAGHPIRVSLVLNSVLALCKGVPKLNRLVAGTRHNLPVVSRESNAHHVLGVILEPTGGLASSEIPQAEGLIPGAWEGKVTIRWQHNIRNEVAVSLETLLRDAIMLDQKIIQHQTNNFIQIAF